MPMFVPRRIRLRRFDRYGLHKLRSVFEDAPSFTCLDFEAYKPGEFYTFVGRPKVPSPTRIQIVYSDMAGQMEAAAKWEIEHRQSLIDAGWVWHADIQHWLHPDKPGQMIGY